MAFARIEEGPKRGSYTAVAEDGSSFSIPSSLFSSLHLAPDQELSEEEFLRLKREVSFLTCRAKAVSLIARREHGKRELQFKLIQKGFDRETSQEVTEILSEKGLLDDAHFAYQFILSRQRKNPEGLSLLRMRLKEKGISSEDIEKAISQYLEDDMYQDDIRRAIEKLSRRSDSRESLMMKLRKKGFSSRDIRETEEAL